jgi:hypothetical protein
MSSWRRTVHDREGCRELFERLCSYLEGELASEGCQELAGHLEDCEPCRHYLESLKGTRGALEASGGELPMPPEEVSRALSACLELFKREHP